MNHLQVPMGHFELGCTKYYLPSCPQVLHEVPDLDWGLFVNLTLSTVPHFQRQRGKT